MSKQGEEVDKEEKKKKKEITPFVTTEMDFEGITLSEISQRQTNTV